MLLPFLISSLDKKKERDKRHREGNSKIDMGGVFESIEKVLPSYQDIVCVTPAVSVIISVITFSTVS